MSYSVKKKKRNLFIPLPLECAKNWNSEILIDPFPNTSAPVRLRLPVPYDGRQNH